MNRSVPSFSQRSQRQRTLLRTALGPTVVLLLGGWDARRAGREPVGTKVMVQLLRQQEAPIEI